MNAIVNNLVSERVSYRKNDDWISDAIIMWSLEDEVFRYAMVGNGDTLISNLQYKTWDYMNKDEFQKTCDRLMETCNIVEISELPIH